MRPRAQTKRGVGDAAPYSNGKRECLPLKCAAAGGTPHLLFLIYYFYLTTLIISKKPGNTGISRDIRTEFTTDLLLSD